MLDAGLPCSHGFGDGDGGGDVAGNRKIQFPGPGEYPVVGLPGIAHRHGDARINRFGSIQNLSGGDHPGPVMPDGVRSFTRLPSRSGAA